VILQDLDSKMRQLREGAKVIHPEITAPLLDSAMSLQRHTRRQLTLQVGCVKHEEQN